MELWNEVMVEKSQQVLFQLKGKVEFIVIGGWACWLYTQLIKSKDIDLYIDFKEFFELQKIFLEQGIFVSLNQRLKKYEAKIDEIDIDIYTPEHCPLIIPCTDVLSQKWFETKEGFKVVSPEVLLVLKLMAEEQRGGTIKGFKDRIDILSLLYKLDLNKKLVYHLEKRYSLPVRERLKRIILESHEEYSYLFPEAENLRKLKKLRKELLSKI